MSLYFSCMPEGMISCGMGHMYVKCVHSFQLNKLFRKLVSFVFQNGSPQSIYSAVHDKV